MMNSRSVDLARLADEMFQETTRVVGPVAKERLRLRELWEKQNAPEQQQGIQLRLSPIPSKMPKALGGQEGGLNPIPEGTLAYVRVSPRGSHDPVFNGWIDQGKHARKPFYSINFEIVSGPHAGRSADFFAVIDPDDPAFREAAEMFTGALAGEVVHIDQFRQGLESTAFEAEIGPKVRYGELSAFSKITHFVRRVAA